jgi:hypothetical protein
MASVLMYTLFACVALLAISLITASLRRRGATQAALALLAVSLCALVAISGVRWLLQHNPSLFFGGHYTPARALIFRQLWTDALVAAAGPICAVGVAYVIGVSFTAARLIHAARRPHFLSPEHSS